MFRDLLCAKPKETEVEREYYKTRIETEAKRQKGERIYYEPTKGYYIVKLKVRDWWNV